MTKVTIDRALIEQAVEALSECILAAGIVRPDIAGFSGPQLLMFANDLKEMLQSALRSEVPRLTDEEIEQADDSMCGEREFSKEFAREIESRVWCKAGLKFASPAVGPVANAWDEGYLAGIADERMSEANIGISGLNAKVEPARNNPYRSKSTPSVEPAVEPVQKSGCGRYAWVPIEPSTAMLVAGNHCQPGSYSAALVWEKMIACAGRHDYRRPVGPLMPHHQPSQHEAIVKLREALESVERRSRWSDSYINDVAEKALKDTEEFQ